MIFLWIMMAPFAISGALSGAESEPLCLSRFDYDYKLLSKLVELEAEQKKLLESITQQQTEITQQQSEIDKLQNIITRPTTEVGSVYTRWGKSTCPGNGTEIIYILDWWRALTTHKGAAANYLCLTKQPSWNKYNDAEQGGGLVYGAEYELDTRSRQYFFGREITDDDPPCAVCRSKRPTVIMIPGSQQCLEGWTKEYHGYLSSGHYTHFASTEFVCLDIDPEVIPDGNPNNDGKLFYLTEVRCGSSSLCPPYVNGRELSCIVCSK